MSHNSYPVKRAVRRNVVAGLAVLGTLAAAGCASKAVGQHSPVSRANISTNNTEQPITSQPSSSPTSSKTPTSEETTGNNTAISAEAAVNSNLCAKFPSLITQMSNATGVSSLDCIYDPPMDQTPSGQGVGSATYFFSRSLSQSQRTSSLAAAAVQVRGANSHTSEELQVEKKVFPNLVSKINGQTCKFVPDIISSNGEEGIVCYAGNIVIQVHLYHKGQQASYPTQQPPTQAVLEYFGFKGDDKPPACIEQNYC